MGRERVNPVIYALGGLGYLAVYLAWCAMGLVAWNVLALFAPRPPCPLAANGDEC